MIRHRSLVIALFCHISVVFSYNFDPFIKEIGGTFCKYLAMKNQIARHYLRTCENPSCSWDNWQDLLTSLTSLNDSNHNISSHMSVTSINKNDQKHTKHQVLPHKERVVLSYGHNGFGNQLWQHTVAFMIAESLKARLYIAMIPDNLCFDGATPPNTFAGMSTMEKLLPSEVLFDSLPQHSSDKMLCDSESFFLSDRPRDWRNNTYSGDFKGQLHHLLDDKKPRCIKMLGELNVLISLDIA